MDTKQTLRQIALFRDLSDPQLTLLETITHKELMYPDSIVYEEDEAGQSLYVITSGTVRFSKNTPTGEEETARLGAGSFFGELALLGRHIRTSTAIAHETTELIRLDDDALAELLASDVDMAARFYRALARELAKRLEHACSELSFLKSIVHDRRS